MTDNEQSKLNTNYGGLGVAAASGMARSLKTTSLLRKSLQSFVFVLILSILTAIVLQYAYVYKWLTLTDKNNIVNNFRNMDKMGLPYNYALGTNKIARFLDAKHELPKTFIYNNTEYNLKERLQKYWTTGLVILKIDNVTTARLLHEKYYLGNDEDSKAISWSTGKSIVSALMGIAIQEGHIRSVDDLVTEYVPSLVDSGFHNVTIKQVLQMSSGIKFDENYFSLFSDISTMVRNVVLGYDLETYTQSLYRKTTPGTQLDYVSINTQVLGMILNNAIGKPLTKYLDEKLWSRGGFECDLFWLREFSRNRELAFGTINTCTRDYARFGWLYLNKGRSPLNGVQLINEQWIADSSTPLAPHLLPRPHKEYPLGYGYQWWIPPHDDEASDDYLAIGVYNQFIYISPQYGIVIAKNSAYADYDHDDVHSELETIAMFRTIAKAYSKL